jgi:hypothetical protein
MAEPPATRQALTSERRGVLRARPTPSTTLRVVPLPRFAGED